MKGVPSETIVVSQASFFSGTSVRSTSQAPARPMTAEVSIVAATRRTVFHSSSPTRGRTSRCQDSLGPVITV